MLKKTFRITKDFDVKLDSNVLYFFNQFITFYFIMPQVFYFKKQKGLFSFMVTGQREYKLLYNTIMKMSKNLYYFYFFRLKLKGLGFRLNRISEKLCMFFFGPYNYVYLHIDMLTFTRGRNIIIMDNNKKLLNTVFYQLLVLKRMDLYSKKKTFYSFDKVKYFKKRI